MRLSVAGLRRVVKRDLPVEFTEDRLTSYGGLELVRRYFERIGLRRHIEERMKESGVPSDYGSSRLVLLVITLLLVGARRLEHLSYIAGDPLVQRICSLHRLPSRRTVANWLRQFVKGALSSLCALNSDIVLEQLKRLALRRVTLDVDGTVVRTGPTVAWAFRGFNPHHRKDKSYYPLLAHIAQTGQILRVRNRPGNVHDSKGAVDFLREVLRELRDSLGRAVVLEVRMDGAFFQGEIIRLLERFGCLYAIKVPFWKGLGLKHVVAACQAWTPLDASLSFFETSLFVKGWRKNLRVVIYRKRVRHETAKNFQLDLFSPDDGHFEYSAVTTNTTLAGRALWHFIAGRGAQEKTIAELKGGFAFDVVPTRDYRANSAWQQLCILAHNLMKGFQLETVAAPKRKSPKRTASFLLQNVRSIRFLLIARAGRLCRPSGRHVLRLSANPAAQQLYQRVSDALAA
jgi:hypothetical protein